MIQAFRDNGRIQTTDATVAEQLWQVLKPHFEGLEVDGLHAVGCNPNIRLYRSDLLQHYYATRLTHELFFQALVSCRYTTGQRFGKHIDDSVRVGQGSTLYTLLVYLNPPLKGPGPALDGGETKFYGVLHSLLHLPLIMPCKELLLQEDDSL